VTEQTSTEQTNTETAQLVPSAMVEAAGRAHEHAGEVKRYAAAARLHAKAAVKAARAGDLTKAADRTGKSYAAASKAASAGDLVESAAWEAIESAQRSAIRHPASAAAADRITVAMVKLAGKVAGQVEESRAQHSAGKRAERAAVALAEEIRVAAETASASAGDLTLTVRRVRTDADGHTVYASTITETATGTELHADTDLSTGAWMDKGPEHTLGILVGFLSAAAESWNHSGPEGENAQIFPAHVTERAAAVSDELDMLSIELDEH
jgi:hypothetical protein